ncbi:hypothetical protein D9758_017879 [Tetrapyrgos nigripes]|uniref:Uncharacterized protein n=1 Tax=Tetrapyrgos nigripes TaxID=182062 RepID=A0A8H5BBJ2_9AGAR|nr:hypothetical protein D9758_017879 [Tetrapyrgos nigripes]
MAALNPNMPIQQQLTEAFARVPAGQDNPPPLPGPYTSGDDVIHAKNVAHSVRANRRNQECGCHGLYSQTFTDLLSPYSNLSAEIHRTFYVEFESLEDSRVITVDGRGHHAEEGDWESEVSDEEVDLGQDIPYANAPTARTLRNRDHLPRPDYVEIDEGVDDPPEEYDENPENSQDAHKDDEDDGEDDNLDDGDNLSSFNDVTVHLKQGLYKEFIPDLTVVHSRLRLMNTVTGNSSLKKIRHFLYRHGIQSTHFCLVLIGEFKHGPRRSTDFSGNLEELQTEIDNRLQQAISDLLAYCTWYFAAYPHVEAIIAFAACGIYWKAKLVHRDSLPLYIFEDGDYSSDEIEQEKKDAFLENWGPVFVIGTEDSDSELTELRNAFFHPLGCDGFVPARPAGH